MPPRRGDTNSDPVDGCRRAEARHGIQCLVLARGARSSKVRRKKNGKLHKIFFDLCNFLCKLLEAASLENKGFCTPESITASMLSGVLCKNEILGD